MKKIITIGVTLAAALSLAACGSSSSSSSKSSDAKSSQSSKAASSSKADTAKVTKADYDAIKLGDMTKSGQGGDTFDALTTKFGKPASSTTSETNGIKTEMDTWDNVDGKAGAHLVMTFVDKNAVGKNITNLAVALKKNVSLADYNGIATGTKFADVNAKFGDPASLNESLMAGQKTVIAIYTNGDMSSMTLTFSNDALTTKAQSNLK
ncbi:DUF3862 domain-containing protein [Lacticaseibacillus jixiensis]|uniref:DUF3862 domain-containing protein n=1 Tax=Lacticaseibacillus jixiensis TaxID=3231926 RepID=UPI0036F44977